MFEDDICYCGNSEECPHKNKCRRAKMPAKAGIYTMSLFYNDNVNKENCEYFYPINKEDE